MSYPLLLDLRDSRPGQPIDNENVPWFLQAIDRLNQENAQGKLRYVSLSGKHRPAPGLERLIDYRVTGYSLVGSRSNPTPVASKLDVDVSHIIGSYTTHVSGYDVRITISPRWGKGILAHLLRYTTGIHAPPSPSGSSQWARDSAEWLLVLAWITTLHQAMRRSHIPKEYQVRRSHGPFFRGRLDVARQIRDSVSDASRFHCIDSPLTADTGISRTIRCVFRRLSTRREYHEMLRDAAGYDRQLTSLGVSDADVTSQDIDRIRYTRMTGGYRPLMELSRALLQRLSAKPQQHGDHGISFFIDIAELWENYLHAILVRELPAGYSVYNPNERGGEALFTDGSRHIRPDLIVQRDGLAVAVLDAKFKAYSGIGRHAADGISREDLHQMATYLYHHGTPGHPITGCFVSPVAAQPNALKSLARQTGHHITVLGLPIEEADDSWIHDGRLRQLEQKFVADLLASLAQPARQR